MQKKKSKKSSKFKADVSAHPGATPQHSKRAAKLLHRCKVLARKPDILAEFSKAMRATGLEGEKRNSRILFLSLISRSFERPVSVVVKGARSGGKSTLVRKVTNLFPPSAYFEFTGMSDKALARTSSPLEHRFIIVTEAAGLKEGGDYFLRSLLSEGRLRYFVTVGNDTRTIEKEGPTGLILTTTANKLYEDDESRLLSIEIADGRKQNRKVLSGAGEAVANPQFQMKGKPHSKWPALLEWIHIQSRPVVIPFGPSVADLMPDLDSRMRRDVWTVFGLVMAHALLHCATRKRDTDGNIVAEIRDYAAVRELINSSLAYGVELSVPIGVRKLVKAVSKLDQGSGVSGGQLVEHLELHKAGVSRYAKAALDLGYLANLQDGKGKAAKYQVADEMPLDRAALPDFQSVQKHHRKRVGNKTRDTRAS